VTFSYDDGCRQDERLAGIFTRYGLKATFNFNNEGCHGFCYTKEQIEEIFLSRGHEIAVHGAMHRANGRTRPIEGIRDVLECRLELEKNAIEAELKDSRIAIMLSQIRPHFIYNTLGTIERLCLKDPQMAFELVRNFSLYLRGNFSELDSVAPIRFSEEIKHVQYYVNIEQVRFPDMTIVYQLEFSDFVLPAISVQPLVENAIKHGLMPLESGGRVVIRSFATDTHYCVEVTDNGAGFDTSALIDKKEHVGLQNIRERLGAIVSGELIVESEIGKGTRATIKIPKEGKV
jgi:LytS/YehU family sensor histidine kinase